MSIFGVCISRIFDIVLSSSGYNCWSSWAWYGIFCEIFVWDCWRCAWSREWSIFCHSVWNGLSEWRTTYRCSGIIAYSTIFWLRESTTVVLCYCLSIRSYTPDMSDFSSAHPGATVYVHASIPNSIVPSIFTFWCSSWTSLRTVWLSWFTSCSCSCYTWGRTYTTDICRRTIWGPLYGSTFTLYLIGPDLASPTNMSNICPRKICTWSIFHVYERAIFTESWSESR